MFKELIKRFFDFLKDLVCRCMIACNCKSSCVKEPNPTPKE